MQLSAVLHLNLSKKVTPECNIIISVKKCDQCGTCCKLFLINLSEEEYFSGRYKTQLEKFGLIDDFPLASECGANILKQKRDGSCIYLKKNNCSIHKARPQVCREFFCASKLKKFQNMVEQVKKKKITV